MMKYQVNYLYKYPIRLLYGTLKTSNNTFSLPFFFPSDQSWGEVMTINGFEIIDGESVELEIGWISLQSQKTFYYNTNLQLSENVVSSPDIYLIVGLSPTGEFVVWLNHKLKSTILLYAKGIDISNKMTDDMIIEAGLKTKEGRNISSISQLCLSDLIRFSSIPGFNPSEIVSNSYFEKLMRQYSYQYIVNISMEGTSDSGLDYIEQMLYDGTHDKLHDGGLMSYHQAGRPKKLAVKWHIKKSEFTAYFWFEDEEICKVFDRFYGAHPETKADFMIRIDSDNKKFELALYRYGLKEPQVINESAYQLIVFKNKFEYFRSENYNQPRGAWVW